MIKPTLKSDGTFEYKDSNGNISLVLKDQPIFDEGTNEIIGYETVCVNIPN